MISVHLIITAAGLSRRHPPNKLLLPLENQTVIERTVAAFTDTAMAITVVTGHQREQVETVLQRFGERISIAHNPAFAGGLASSLVTGVQAVSVKPDYWAFCNGDKPFIKSATIVYLLAELERVKPLILVPTFSERMGHPTFFSSELTPELLGLSGDAGARQIIQRHGRAVSFVPVTDEGVVMDMDRYLDNRKNQ